jgi:hypothetical protein
VTHGDLTRVTPVPIPALDYVHIPGAVEATEKAGQAAFVADATALPVKIRPPDTEAAFVALGFTFGEPIDGVFREATLPPGWVKVATGHDMWSEIHDETGRKRVAVFYKAACYDRNAFMRLEA